MSIYMRTIVLLFLLVSSLSAVDCVFSVTSIRLFDRFFRLIRFRSGLDHDFRCISTWLEGRYNNEVQALADLRNKKPTARDGGHEFVAAKILPFIDDSIQDSKLYLATYFFGKHSSTPDSPPFRCRCYQLLAPSDHSKESSVIKMKLLRPKSDTSRKLIASNYTISQTGDLNEGQGKLLLSDFEEIDGCDISWHKKKTWYGETFFMGKLSNKDGFVRLQSERDPTQTILVKDELRLFQNRLWVNDRVYLANTMQLIIGNRDNIPYKFLKEQ